MKCFSIHLILFVSFYCDLMMSVSAKSACPSISIKHGSVKRRGKGRMVRFICSRTYLLAGEKYSTCIHGKWDTTPPKCVRATCKPITLQQGNDKVLIHSTHNGAVQHFFCMPGYFLNGPSDVYCDGSNWDNNAPTCLANNTKPKLSCDFEEDLCGWTHDLNHDFDWRRENFDTPSGSIGTGPTFDHTTGVGGDGYYMYIESSGRNENDTARLISPIYEKIVQEVCLEFYYHMFGTTIGSLRVYLKKSKQNWTLDPDLAVFSKSGNHGDKWYRGYERLGVIDDDFQIIFEGVRGSGYVSDIAIDDVKIIINCPEDSGYSTQSESPYTDIAPTVESCANRCGQMESRSSDNFHITCDCDDDCYYKRRCCPDYYDICLTDSDSTYSAFSYEVAATEISNITDIIEDTSTDTYYSTIDTTQAIVNARLTPPASQTIVFTSSPVRNRPFTRPAQVSTSRNITQTTTTQRMLPKLTRPIIYVRPPPPTMKVIRKVITKYITKKPTTPTMIYKNSQPTIPRKEIESDAIDVPQPTNNDEGLLLTQLPEDNRGNSKELWSNENENSVDSPFFRPNVGESGKLLFSQKEPDSSNTNVFLIVISVIGTVVFISIAAFVVFWKYRRSGHRMHFSRGESQSDVRFLTSDEIIDFSLSDCYDE